ncbi:helix-turn-helix domain-containing protein [Lachnospiraceae bacterium NSJ-143]|nr:helix-turn-helix domain-containing protein [Lachnospiraceae bacterium NSJ-143]
MDIGKRIKSKREELGITQTELALKINSSKQTVYKYENGIVSNIPFDKIELIAQALNTTPACLMGWDKDGHGLKLGNIFPIELKKYPLIGEIACGKPIFCNDDRESYVIAGADLKADFCLKAKGDSMVNARILDGDVVFIRSQQEVENGEIAAVIIDDSATLKRVFYYKEKDMIILKPENPAYEDLIYIGDEIDKIHILGKAIAFQSDVK